MNEYSVIGIQSCLKSVGLGVSIRMIYFKMSKTDTVADHGFIVGKTT